MVSMGKIIVGTALGGWAVIVWIAWRLAGARIEQCYYANNDCIIRTTATRDYILTAGLSVGLAILVASLIALAMVKARQGSRKPGPATRWWSTKRDSRAMPRLGVE